MTAARMNGWDDSTVKGRLMCAADAEISARGADAVQMEAIAKRAGVSRATAFRQLGSLSEVLVQVAMLHAQRHDAALRQLMDGKTGAFTKIEVALVYTARELPRDPAMAALIARHSASVHDPRVHQAATDLMGPVLREGQHNGEVRTDVELDQLVDFIVEQTYLAAEEIDRSEDAVRTRFRLFVIPALEARTSAGGEYLSRAREVEEAVRTTREALDNLARQLSQANCSDNR